MKQTLEVFCNKCKGKIREEEGELITPIQNQRIDCCEDCTKEIWEDYYFKEEN